MRYPKFTTLERMVKGGVRRKWFDVEANSLPLTFYLPLYESVSTVTVSETTAVMGRGIRCARYERLPHNQHPYATRGIDNYEYKGDEFR